MKYNIKTVCDNWVIQICEYSYYLVFKDRIYIVICIIPVTNVFLYTKNEIRLGINSTMYKFAKLLFFHDGLLCNGRFCICYVW